MSAKTQLRVMSKEELYAFIRLMIEFHLTNSSDMRTTNKDIYLDFNSALASLEYHYENGGLVKT